MRCSTARGALSAVADGEEPVADLHAVQAHLSRCAGCRGWEQVAAEVTRRSRIGRRLPDDDLGDRIAAAVARDVSRRRSRRQWLVAAAIVSLCGCLQLAVSVPLLLLAHHPRGTAGHPHLVVMLELLVGASFLLGAVVLLWHTRGVPVDPPLAVASTADRSSSDIEGVA
jgi:predicted anti-sigma-YlaC factor YlaD